MKCFTWRSWIHDGVKGIDRQSRERNCSVQSGGSERPSRLPRGVTVYLAHNTGTKEYTLRMWHLVDPTEGLLVVSQHSKWPHYKNAFKEKKNPNMSHSDLRSKMEPKMLKCLHSNTLSWELTRATRPGFVPSEGRAPSLIPSPRPCGGFFTAMPIAATLGN